MSYQLRATTSKEMIQGNGRQSIPQFAKVKYTAVYPGVDLVYYGKQQELEYDFVVAAGTSPRAIKLGFQGAKGISIGKEGDLIIQTQEGEVRHRKPAVYQELTGRRQEIEGRYAIRGKNEVGFEVGDYDSQKPLVIRSNHCLLAQFPTQYR